MIDHICSNLIKFRTAYLNLGIIILGFWKDFQFFDSDFIRDRTVRLKKVLLLLFWSLKGIFKGGVYIFNFSSQLSGTYYWFSWRILGSEFSAIFCSLEGTPIIDEVLWRLLSQRLEDSWRLLSRGFALAFALGGSGLTWLSHWKKFVRVFCSAFSIDHLRERRWGLETPLLGVRLIPLVLLSRQLQQWKHILLSILPNSWPQLWEIILGRSTVHLV